MEPVPTEPPRGVRPLTVMVVGVVMAGALLGARAVGRFAAPGAEALPTSPTALVSVDLARIEPVPTPSEPTIPGLTTSVPAAPWHRTSSPGSGGDVTSVREALARQLELPVAVVRCLAELVGDEELLDDPLGAVADNPACAGG